MERHEFIKLFKKVLVLHNPIKEMERLLYEILDKADLDIESEPGNSYRLCVILYYAILCELAEKWQLNENNIQKSKYYRSLLKRKSATNDN